MESLFGSKMVFTTGEVAELFDVNINTVVKWLEDGLLKGFKFPGLTARRVPRKELLDFIAKQRFPVKEVERRSVEVVLVSSNRRQMECFRGAMEDAFGYKLYIASCAFETGLVCATSTPAAIFVHLRHSDFDPEGFRKLAAGKLNLLHTKLIAIAAGKAPKANKGFDGFLSMPASGDEILDAIDTAAAGRTRVIKFPLQKH
jgi:excisionase family DNA binding protein